MKIGSGTGLRIMALKKVWYEEDESDKEDIDGHCQYLDVSEGGNFQCMVYDVRPEVCQRFPFSVDQSTFLQINEVRIEPLEGVSECPYELNDVGRSIEGLQIELESERMGQTRYNALVREFNKTSGTPDEFLKAIGLV